MNEASPAPFVAVETLLSEGVHAGTIATAIEQQGIYTRDRFGRLVLAGDDERAAVLDVLADRHVELRFPCLLLGRSSPYDPNLRKITLELFGWPVDKRPDHAKLELGASKAAEARGRTDNLKRAIFSAWENGFPVGSTASELFEHMTAKDDTGFIRGRDGDELTWENGGGTVSRTTLKALSKRLSGYKKEFTGGQ